MNKTFAISTFRLVAAAALALAAPMAAAGGHPEVSWSISVGSHAPAPQVYAPPPAVVYVQPQPVYVAPRPVYVRPAAVIQYGQPYYVEEVRHKRIKRHHWKHSHHHRRDHDRHYGY